jgi:tetratricopeptide (TPR) repeat protein
MAERVPFINREDELSQIERLINEQGTRRVLCIHAPGGIGKTRLLQEVREQYAEQVFITEIIDFDDFALRIPTNIELAITEQIGRKTFNTYLQSLQTYHQARREGASPGRLAQKRLEARQAFIDSFNGFSTGQRTVLLLDTTETLEGTDAWNYVVDILSQRLKNLLLIIAGREAQKIYQELEHEIGRDVGLIELPSLDEEASEEYLRLKQELLHITLEPELTKKLLQLAGGRPILIDLAVEWLAREIPLEWLIESELEELKSLSDDQMDKRREEFEYQLVGHIAQIRTPMDRLTLLMSRVYPLDEEMIGELLQVPDDRAARLFRDAKSCVFVKSFPDGRISLHDEMRRMVEERLWPEADPDESRQRRDSELAVASLERRVRALQAQINQHEAAEQAHPQQDITTDPFSGREVLKQRLWALQTRALRHRMYLKPDQGFREFNALFQKSFNRRDSDFCIMLREIAGKYRDNLSEENRIRLDLSQGLLDILKGDLEAAVNRIRAELGHLEQLKVTRDLDRTCNSLGYCYRLQGDWELAIASYERALYFSNLEGDGRQIAETMNNIANVCRYNGDFERGLRYSKISLKIREKLGDELSIANSCYVCGMISWEIGNTAEAATYLKRARELYQKLEDQVRAAWVDKYTGYFHYRIGDTETATEYLEQAAAIFSERNAKSDLADTLNMLSRVARRRGFTERPLEQKEEAFKEAEGCALEGLEIAQEVGDHYKIAECNLTLCSLYYRWTGEYYETSKSHEEAQKFYKQAQEHYERGFPIAREGNYNDLLSVYHMVAGNVAYDEGLLAYDSGNKRTATRKWDEAFEHYLDECYISASYKEARFDRALSELALRLMRLPDPEITQQYCDFLMRQWEKRKLDRQYPQLVAECKQVKEFLVTPEEYVVRQISQIQEDLFTMGDWRGAVKAGRQVLEHNQVYLRNSDVVRALNVSAFALRQQGHFFQARRLCSQGLHIGEVIEDWAAVAESRYIMGTIHWIVGNTAEAATQLRRARELFEGKLKDAVKAARVHRYEGFLYYRIGNLEKSLELLERAQVCFEKHNQLADLAEVLAVESRVLGKSERYEEAKQAAARANEIARKLGNNYVVAETLISLHTLNTREGQAAQAQQCLQEGRESAHRFGYDLLISVYEQLVGDIAFDEGSLGQAFEHYVAALAHGAKFEYARLHRTLDPCIDRLVGLPQDLIRYYADYVVREWRARNLDTEFPDVINTFELVKEYREYVS